MNQIYFTADLHFGHANINTFEEYFWNKLEMFLSHLTSTL